MATPKTKTSEDCDQCRNITRYKEAWSCIICGKEFEPKVVFVSVSCVIPKEDVNKLLAKADKSVEWKISTVEGHGTG